MTTPALGAIRLATGTPSDVIAGGASGYGALEVLRGNPDTAHLIARADGNWWARCVQLWRLIRSGQYDRVIILPSINAYRWAARLAGAKQIIYVPPAPLNAHLASHMLDCVAASLGIAPGTLQLQMTVSGAARACASNLLAEAPRGARLIGLNIGATRPQKRWPNQAFASLAIRLAARGCTPVLIGGPGDRDAAEEDPQLAGRRFHTDQPLRQNRHPRTGRGDRALRRSCHRRQRRDAYRVRCRNAHRGAVRLN